MHRAPCTLITTAVLAASAALASPAAAQICAPEGPVLFIPKHYSVQSIEYMQVGDAPVRVTLWTDRLGPRTTDNTMAGLPKGIWTPSNISNPAGLQVTDRRDWRLGFDVLYAEGGSGFSRPFECIGRELHANGPEPWGFYLLRFIPHELEPGQQDFLVRVTLHRGPIKYPETEKGK